MDILYTSLCIQVAGINLEDGDIISHMSVSDSATAVLTKKNHVFVCTNFIVKHIRYVHRQYLIIVKHQIANKGLFWTPFL